MCNFLLIIKDVSLGERERDLRPGGRMGLK